MPDIHYTTTTSTTRTHNETWESEPNLHCPKCGRQTLYQQPVSDGELTHVCVACGARMAMDIQSAASTPKHDARLAALRTAVRFSVAPITHTIDTRVRLVDRWHDGGYCVTLYSDGDTRGGTFSLWVEREKQEPRNVTGDTDMLGRRIQELKRVIDDLSDRLHGARS